jgi:hypothetical protein
MTLTNLARATGKNAPILAPFVAVAKNQFLTSRLWYSAKTATRSCNQRVEA